ncbi:hypothetical protein [Roseibium sp.]|uniref:hypothetical protein n=1 Tax=Roseibium sp. TaxID=1936156 RepID=UPI003A96CC24
MTFIDEMEALARTLVNAGYDVATPVREETTFDWAKASEAEAVARKAVYLTDYFEEIRRSDAVIIANYSKHGIGGYIGANTLMEAACGHVLAKPVYLMFSPGPQSCRLEALAVASAVCDGDVTRLLEVLQTT